VLSQSYAYGRTRARQQAALLSLNPQTGAILAYVGGKNYRQSQFDRVTQARRSPGSLFKIFTYTTAMDRGYEPTRVYLDAPIKLGDWQPKNYDRGYHGYMTIAKALVTSDNIVAVKVMNELGPETVVAMAQQMGIHSPLEANLSTTLGASGVNLLEMTSAFGVLANQGVRAEPYAIEKIVDDGGHEVYRQHPVKTDVLNRTTVDTMVKMMLAVVQRGTGQGANIGRPVAGKTGTSDDYRDAWFIGFTPDVVTGVWVGNDNNTPMPGMTGGSLPAVIWRSYMRPYMAGKPTTDFDLAYSKPLTDQDFTSYDIKNLSDKENNNPMAVPEMQDGTMQQDPALPQDPLADTDGSPPPEPQTTDPNAPNAGPYPTGPQDAPVSPVAPTPGQPVTSPPTPPSQQPMPGYGAPPGNPAPRAGYGIIPIDRSRRNSSAPPTPPRRIDPDEAARNASNQGTLIPTRP
jgi:penicillin-binding protein 1A